MERPDQEAIDTFMSITGVSEAAAIQKIEAHHGNLNEAVNAHFIEGDRNTPIIQEGSLAVPQDDDIMDIDDPTPTEFHRPSSSLLPFPRDLNPFSILQPNFSRNIFSRPTDLATQPPFVSHPRELREIPIEVKDGDGTSGHIGNAPIIEEVTDIGHDLGPDIRGSVVIDDEDDEYASNAPFTGISWVGKRGNSSRLEPNPSIVGVPDNTDIEEEMIRAAIEASKQDATMSNELIDNHIDLRDSNLPRQSHLEDAELAHAVSLSLQTAEREKVQRELAGKSGAAEAKSENLAGIDNLGNPEASNGRQSKLEAGGSSIQDETEDVEDMPLVRHRRRRVSSVSVETNKDIEQVEVSPPRSPLHHGNVRHPQDNENDFPADEWGGISSEEHDEAVMLEAAMFGGIPEGSGYHFPYAPHHIMQNGINRPMGPFPGNMPRPPSPSLTAQRLIREQQDDEYLASLQADREKELKAREDAEAAFVEQTHKENALQRQLQDEQELERQLAAKEGSLPQEPLLDDENAVTLLVRMPDGSRRGRRFRKSDKLQSLFDFIDVGRGIKPNSYRLVRPYPRRAFSIAESTSSLDELGLTSKQEALFLELI